jgi:hypothetical protein
MGNYLPHLNRKNRHATCASAIWTPPPETDALRNLEIRAASLFPWHLLGPDRKIAAILTGQPRGALFPISDLACLFAGVNLGVPSEELGVTGPAANFMTLSAPRTRSWAALTQTADFFIAARAIRGCTPVRDEILAQAARALADLERRVSALPDWLTVHKLDTTWFVIRPTPQMASVMWDEASRRRTAERAQ